MQDARRFEGPDQVELDVVGRKAGEQRPALAEKDRPQLNLHDGRDIAMYRITRDMLVHS